MRVLAMQFVSQTWVSPKFRTLVCVALMMFFIFSIVYVRQQSVNLGYAISHLSAQVEDKRIVLEALEVKRTTLANPARLYRMADEMGFELAGGEKVHYVR